MILMTDRIRGVVTVLGTCASLVLVVAALPWLRGEDPATTVLRARFTARGADGAAVAALRHQLGLSGDPVTDTTGWLERTLHGDLGTSWVSGRPVADIVLPALAVSGTLAVTAMVIAVALAGALLVRPIRDAIDTGRPMSSRLGALTAVLAALPEVVLASALVLVVAVRLHLLPALGWGQPRSVVLPALALAIPAAGLLARLLTTVVDQALAEPWTATWRVNGVPRSAVVATLARRMTAVGAPQLVVVLVTVLGSAVAVEQVFALPGAGSLAVQAALSQDLPVLQACLAGFLLAGLVTAAFAGAVHRLLMGPAVDRLDGAALHLPDPPPTRLTRVALGTLVVVVAAGLPRDGSSTRLDDRLAAPSRRHPLGADGVGRDVLGRLAHATVLTVGLALLVTAAATIVALVVALPARRARLGVTDVLMTVPSTVVGIVIASAVGPGLPGAVLAVLGVAWIPLAVHTRTLVVQARSAGYVHASMLSGSTRPRTLAVHVLPAVLPPLAKHALVRVPAVALGIAGLSFIGLGADPDAAELGAMLADGLHYLERAPALTLAPAGILVLLALVAGTARTGSGGSSRRRTRPTA